MALFDFLKIFVRDKKASGKKPAARKAGGSTIEVDSKSFPLAAITTKGFVATQFDDSLIAGQNARITVKVDDAFGRFSFPASVVINDVKDGKCVGAWMMLAPEFETAIRQHAQKKKATAGR